MANQSSIELLPDLSYWEQNVLNLLRGIQGGGIGTNSGGTESPYLRVQNASDLVKTFTYADAGTADERVTSIVSSSASIGMSFTDTYSYDVSSGAYRVSKITRSQS